MAEETALVKQQTGIATYTYGGSPIALRSLQDYLTLGEVLFKSGYFGDIKSAAQAVAKMIAGAEMGFGPMASLSGVYIQGSKPSFMANLIASAVKRNGYDYAINSLTDKECELTFYGRGGKLLGTSRFTWDDAVKAELTIGKNAHSWRHYPRNMLFSRAISNGARWYTPDIFGGVTPYTPDEVDMVVDGETGEVVVQTPTGSTSPNGQPPKQTAPVAPQTPVKTPTPAPITPSVTEQKPVKTPEPEVSVKTVKMWDGEKWQEKNATDRIKASSGNWFSLKFMGDNKAFKNQYALFGSLEKHFGRKNFIQGNDAMTYDQFAALVGYAWYKQGDTEHGYLDPRFYADKIVETAAEKVPFDIPSAEKLLERAKTLNVKDFESTLEAAFVQTDLTKMYEHEREMANQLLNQIENGVVAPDDSDKHLELLAK